MKSLSRQIVAIVTIAIFLSVLYLTGCESPRSVAVSDPQTQDQSLTKYTSDDVEVQAVMEVQDRNTPTLMQDKNVVGTATTLTDDGRLAIVVYLDRGPKLRGGKERGVSSLLPSTIEGVPVIAEVSGKFRAMDGGAAHRVKQTAPIQLGTSGGWRYDLANGYCCGGTLGSLIKKGSTQYVLSNYHVFWGDNVLGGNNRKATAGDPVIQPGLIEVGCNANNTQNVATLSGSGSLPSANVDAGYAQVISGMVRTDGYIMDIGSISASTLGPFINQAVKKSGRTTGLTRSSVSGLNATISVAYSNECAGGAAFTKTFTGQIVIKNNGSKFLNSGDSGSLMVQDVTTNPRAVGLLFAGSNTSAIANPIGAVLSWAGATMVGN